ncbi:MAG TPA: dehydrogenase E1 component subunit alpha/beta [Myxococcaceae bacterium]|jgi:2-oxoisovalerate dehydrogenase E1 component
MSGAISVGQVGKTEPSELAVQPAEVPGLVGPGGEPLSGEFLQRALRLCQQGRALHEGLDRQFRSGEIPFYLGFAGHEVAQVAAGLALRPGSDWFFPYYRDSAFVLAVGHTVEEQLMSVKGLSEDVSSGGRQGPNHWGSRELNIPTQSSCAGSQFLEAVGVAEVLVREGSDAVVFVSSGEGTTSQGEFYEALNWAALRRLPVLFFIEDNGFAISTPVSQQTPGGSIARNFSAMAQLTTRTVDGGDFIEVYSACLDAATRARMGQGPTLIQAKVLRLCSHSSADDERKYRSNADIAADRQQDPLPEFERRLVEAGILTQAQVNSQRQEAVARVAQAVERVSESAPHSPQTVAWHVYGAAHEAPPRDGAAPSAEGTPVRLVDAIRNALEEEMAANPRVVVLGEDVGNSHGGVFGITRGLIDRFGGGRVFNTPLAEASIVGVGMGMAMAGWRPVVEIQFADYIFPAMAQLRSEVAMLRYRSRGMWNCPLIIRAPCGGYVGGGHYHSQSIEGFFTHMPGLRVVYPSNAADAKGLLKAALRGDDPVLFLEHKDLYRGRAAARPEPEADYVLPLGVAAVVREGTSATVVTYGAMVHKALAAAEALAAEGVQVEVVDLRTLNPLDEDTLVRSVRKTGRAVVAYEANRTGGFGAELASRVSECCFPALRAPVRRVAALDTPVPFAPALEEAMLPQAEDIKQALREVLAGR